MPNTVLIGAQWGDEGKGKVIDVLARDADLVVRYQGGGNAGHTVKIGEQLYVLHLVPSGILHPDKTCVIGNGVVVDPIALLAEIRELGEKGVDVAGRLVIGDRAHVVLPYHKALDECRERRRRQDQKIGTTKRGIGPCYGDKVSRVGLRVADLADPDFGDLLDLRLEESDSLLQALGGDPIDHAAVKAAYLAAAAELAPFVGDGIAVVNRAVQEGKSVLFEGAQGTMLDIDFGTYPFVTSSNATAGGACTGAGLAPHRVDRVVGVIKAYTTRVGEGPFPTELVDETGRLLAREGHEFGATTGRPRRCGWFDGVVARYSAMLNGVDYWAVTKLDVLDTVETIRICTAYECDGRTYETIPANVRVLARCRPLYDEMPGWKSSTRDVAAYDDLPEAARNYVARLCDITGVKLGLLSVGPRRDSTMRVAI